MLPRLGAKYPIAIETTTKTRDEYRSDEYFALDLPLAPAVTVNGEIITEGADVEEEVLETAIRRHCGLTGT